MRAVVCRELGPPSSLVVAEVDPPEVRPGGVIVDVEAAGVNYVDALFVQGRYQIKPALPFTPGSEIAGMPASDTRSSSGSRRCWSSAKNTCDGWHATLP